MPNPTATITKSVSGFDPRSIPGCRLWLDASDTSALTLSGNTVTAWRDKSGLSNNATGGTSPTYSNTSNGVFFNGSNWLSLPDGTLPTGDSSYTYMLVFTFTTGQSNGGIIGGGNGANNQALNIRGNGLNSNMWQFWWNNDIGTTNNTTLNNRNLYETWYTSGGTRNVLLNQAGSNSDTPGTRSQTTGSNAIGRTIALEYLFGFIHEIIVYSNVVTTAQRQQLEGYLSWKWNLQISRFFNPLSIPTPLVWFDAADPTTLTLSGTNVTEWRDKVQNFSVVPSNAGSPPIYTSSGIFFNNTSPNLSGTGVCLCNSTSWVLPTDQNSIFTVCAPNQSNSFRSVFGLRNSALFIHTQVGASEGHAYRLDFDVVYNTNFTASTFGVTLNQKRLDTMIANRALTTFYTNNTPNTFTSNVFNRTPTSNFPVISTAIGGGAGNRLFSGFIYEVLVYSGVLTEQERQQIQGYLASKWDIPNVPNFILSNTHPFYSIFPNTRPLTPIDISLPEYWYDAADRTVVSTTATTNFVMLSNKGSYPGSNLQRASGTPSYQTVFQNGNALINFASGADIASFPGIFPNQPRTRFFATRNLSSGRLGLLNQGTGVATSGRDTVGFDPNATSFAEVAQAVVVNLQTGTIASTSNIFTIYTAMNAAAASNNRVAFTGSTMSLSGASAGAGGYFTGLLSTFVNGDDLAQSVQQFGELISYNSELTLTQAQQIEGYLAWKWGVYRSLPSSHPYSISPPVVSLPFSPTSIPNLIVWLDANDTQTIMMSGSNVLTWIDKSGVGNNANIISSIPPTYAAQDRGIVFNSSSSNTLKANLNTLYSTVASVFIVNKLTPNSTAIYVPRLFLLGSNTTQHAAQFNVIYEQNDINNVPRFGTYLSGATNNNPTGYGTNVMTYISTTFNTRHIYTSIGSANGTIFSISTFVTGNTQLYSARTDSYILNTSNYNNYSIGGYLPGVAQTDDFYNGTIYEVLVFSRGLSVYERQQVEGYLAWKWGVQTALSNVHPFSKFPSGSA